MYLYGDLDQTRIRTFDVLVGTTVGSLVNVGYCDEPAIETVLELRPITVSQLGAYRLGDRVVGAEVKLSFALREITLANLRRALPWGSGSAWGLAPAGVGADLYSYGRVWRFHPRDLASDDHSQDITILRGTPVNGLNQDGHGEEDGTIPLEVIAYPLRSSLPTINLGYLGPDPA